MLVLLLARLVKRLVSPFAQLILQLVLSSSSSLDFDRQVHPRRCCEAEAESNLGEIKLVDVEDVALAVRRVSLQIRPISVLGGTVKVEVAFDEFHELFVDLCELLDRELVLVRPDLLLSQEPQETQLVIEEEEECFAATFLATASTPDSVDVVIGIIRRIVLDHPVNFGEVESSLSNIGAEKNAGLSLAKLEVCACSLLLLLLPVDVFDGHIDIVEQVRVKLDSVAGRHENHDFLLQILPQECEQELKLPSRVNHHITLFKTFDC